MKDLAGRTFVESRTSDGTEQSNAAPQVEGTLTKGLPEAGRNTLADSATGSGEPPAGAAPEQPAVWERPPIVLGPKDQPAAQDGPYISAVPSNEANALVSKLAAQQAEIAALRHDIERSVATNGELATELAEVREALVRSCANEISAAQAVERAEAERDALRTLIKEMGTGFDDVAIDVAIAARRGE